MTKNLFRKEVLSSRNDHWMGEVILSHPVKLRLLTYISLTILLIIVTFIFFGEYTRRSTVQGQLVPELGLIQVYSPQQGVIVSKNIYEGKKVNKGDTLYTISSTKYQENGDINSFLINQIRLKDQSILNEIEKVTQSYETQKKEITHKIDLLNKNLNKVHSLILDRKNRIHLAQLGQKRYENALQQNAVSSEEFEAHQSSYIEQLSQLKSLEREEIILEQDISEKKSTLSDIPNKKNNEIEHLNRALFTNKQELIEIEAKQKNVLKATVTGIVSDNYTETGQIVDSSKPLLSILPDSTKIVAQLYAPSNTIGFIKKGDLVLIRYQAYPYQKFGHAKAHVISVSKVAMSGKNISSVGIVSPQEQTHDEPIYLVRAELEKETIKTYGKDIPLQVGMKLDADVMQETRKLYEWVLEPLFSISGKI